MDQQRDHYGPELLIEVASCHATADRGQWLVAWRIQNQGQEPIEILSTRLPHDKFSSDQTTMDPPLRLLFKESATLELPVACNEEPGSLVENAFLILRLLWLGQPWRAFARHRVALDDTGIPQHLCEVVSVHPVGFSAQRRAGPSYEG